MLLLTMRWRKKKECKNINATMENRMMNLSIV